MSYTLVFRAHSSSRYSVAALLGAIEIDERLQDLEIKAPVHDYRETIRKAERRGEVIVAFSVISTQIERVRREVAELRREHGKRVVLIAGGPHASARPEDLLQVGFDYVVIGEGEQRFPELLWRLMNQEDATNIQGVITEQLEQYPTPRELDQIALDQYPPFAIKNNIVGPIEVTRGCPFACKFCCTPFLTGRRVRHRSVASVIYWLERAVRERGFKRTWFLSPNALCYGGHGRTVEYEKLEGILGRASAIDGLEEIFFGAFPSEVRPEFIDSRGLKILRQYVANKTLQIGIQSGSNRVLKLTNRHHSVEQGVEGVRIAIESGFTPHVDMIFGLPGERNEDLQRSIELCHNLIEMGAMIHGHVFMPLPGSAFENMPAGQLDPESRRQLGELSRRGLLTGSWSHQETLAKELAKKRH